MEYKNLVQTVVNNGGSVHPLIIPEGRDGGLCNPSIFYDDTTGKLLCNIRHVKYTIYQSQKHPHTWGPLVYIHGENDIKLRTINYIAELDPTTLCIKNYKEVNMLTLHEPIWEFIGLEDARLVRWDNKLRLIGVRRDTTTNGSGRMEISTLDDNFNEISRERIPAPGIDDTYCEKNWMPVLDTPNTFVKWTTPTEVVNYNNSITNIIKTSYKVPDNKIIPRDIRGGSQVVRLNDNYIAFTHECALWYNNRNQKYAHYLHRVVVWDENFNVINITDPFYFLGGPIEFVCGLTILEDEALVTFGHQDNAAYILRIPKQYLVTLCKI